MPSTMTPPEYAGLELFPIKRLIAATTNIGRASRGNQVVGYLIETPTARSTAKQTPKLKAQGGRGT